MLQALGGQIGKLAIRQPYFDGQHVEDGLRTIKLDWPLGGRTGLAGHEPISDKQGGSRQMPDPRDPPIADTAIPRRRYPKVARRLLLARRRRPGRQMDARQPFLERTMKVLALQSIILCPEFD